MLAGRIKFRMKCLTAIMEAQLKANSGDYANENLYNTCRNGVYGLEQWLLMYRVVCPFCRLAHGEAQCPQCNGEGILYLHGIERECPLWKVMEHGPAARFQIAPKQLAVATRDENGANRLRGPLFKLPP